MKKKTLYKILGIGLGSLLVLTLVLGIHIYSVYKPKAPNAYSKVMARIDIQDPISPSDAGSIQSWMYRQYGIDHVLVNPDSRIVIFTFFPVKTSGDQIVQNFKTHFSFNAHRYMPSAEELKHSCPVSGSYGYKIYQIIHQIL
jgi:hypothetical protein